MEKQPQREPATVEEIWAILRETSELQKENERERKELQKEHERERKEMQKESAQMQKESAQMQKESAQMQKESDRIRKETEQLLRETEQLLKENAQQQKDTDRRLNKLDGAFDSRWGRFLESLVEGDLVRLLQDRNIPVRHIATDPHGRRNGESFEFDILAVNGEEVVAVEVKTTLRPEDVSYFVRKLEKFTVYMPEYGGKRVYGAVAYLKAHKSVRVHAERQGLFLIRATGNSASIVNEAAFQPRVFG